MCRKENGDNRTPRNKQDRRHPLRKKRIKILQAFCPGHVLTVGLPPPGPLAELTCSPAGLLAAYLQPTREKNLVYSEKCCSLGTPRNSCHSWVQDLAPQTWLRSLGMLHCGDQPYELQRLTEELCSGVSGDRETCGICNSGCLLVSTALLQQSNTSPQQLTQSPQRRLNVTSSHIVSNQCLNSGWQSNCQFSQMG